MLDSKVIELVKATIPAVAQTGTKLTAHFYERMFKHNPEVKDIFNMAHQGSGQQREALFNAVCAYAMNIENPAVLLPAVEKIANKHASLLITKEQYNIVGENLLGTIKELLNPSDEIIDAWAQAYGVLANIFIEREEQIYQENEKKVGGWRGLRDFKVVAKQAQSDCITSFELEPVDGGKVADFKAGQYISVFITDDSFENRQVRQYSLSATANGKSYRIAVRREANGSVSNYLHDKVQVGDVIKLSAPVGDFFLETDKVKNVSLISAGVGQTPMLAMLGELAKVGFKGQVNFIHGSHNSSMQAFVDEVASYKDKLNLNVVRFLSHAQGDACDFEGRTDLTKLKAHLDTENMDYFLCGPVGFMQDMAKQLVDLGIDRSKIHYEVFGPHKVI